MAARLLQRAALFSAAFLLVGCAGPDGFGGSRQAVEEWGRPQGFASLATGNAALPLLSLVRGASQDMLHIYIEGDGAAWPAPWQPPRDPTPERPVALALAAKDPAPAVAYLARPCQYLDTVDLAACPPRYWTSHRFAPEVIATSQVALEGLKARSGARQLLLIGYSGGGVLAMLLAAQRQDVVQVITVASPISVAEWTAWHKVSPLDGSLDPAARNTVFPSAVHFVGGKDRVVPVEVVAPFAAKSGGRLARVPEFDHECCWSRDWQRLLEEIR